MKRPIALTIVMWFAVLCAIGSLGGIAAAIFGLSDHYLIGGIHVTRQQWLAVAAPLVAMVALLMTLSAIGLWRHRRWARTTFMCIWPVIALYGVVCGFVQAVPWSLAIRAVINAAVVGLFSAWLFFRNRASVSYFASAQRNKVIE